MRVLISTVILLFLAVWTLAQAKAANRSWEAKPVDQWDENDVRSILKDSAWNYVLQGKSGETSMAFNALILLDDSLSFTLRSALTVRLAIVRKRQLAEKYDLMDAKHKELFNSRYKSFLECSECEKFYIISVVGDSRVLKNASVVKNRKESIYLSNEKGDKRLLARYLPQTGPGSEALFYFPRQNDKGEPLLRPDSVTLTFNFRSDDDDDPVAKMIQKVNINVKDIVLDGAVIF